MSTLSLNNVRTVASKVILENIFFNFLKYVNAEIQGYGTMSFYLHLDPTFHFLYWILDPDPTFHLLYWILDPDPTFHLLYWILDPGTKCVKQRTSKILVFC